MKKMMKVSYMYGYRVGVWLGEVGCKSDPEEDGASIGGQVSQRNHLFAIVREDVSPVGRLRNGVLQGNNGLSTITSRMQLNINIT